MSSTASKVILPDGTEVTLTDGGCRTKGYFKSATQRSQRSRTLAFLFYLNEHINQSIKEGDDYLMSNKVNKFILPDGTVQQDWTIDNQTLWKPWHSRKKNTLCRGKLQPGRTTCTKRENS